MFFKLPPTCHGVTWLDFDEGGFLEAFFKSDGAAVSEATARWRVKQQRWFARNAG
jgi:hypothetical protein